MAGIAPLPRTSSVVILLLLLLFAAALPPPARSLSYSNYRTLLSLSHSLAARVANIRQARGDIAGYRRATAIADRLERWMGLGFWRLMGSVGWDYVRNYAWGRDLEYSELYGAVPELSELLSLLGEFSRGRTDAERTAWIGRNYGNVLRASKSIVGRLLRVFSKAGPMREAVEALQREVVEGDFLRDCLELGTNDLKGLIQILKDLALQSYSSPDGRMRTAILALLTFSFLSRLDGAPIVPCYFVFGDSINDNGNNNNISTDAKANFPPHGIDFPHGPTGRFSNGRNIADLIVEFLGFTKLLLPYANASGKGILRGLNYASAGAGIWDETGKQWGPIARFSDQLRHHGDAVSRIGAIFGGKETSALSHLSKCLYHVQLGSNDYLGNYFNRRDYSTARLYSPEQFADLLIQTYRKRIRTLQEYGARKMILSGVGQIGCIPAALALYPPRSSPCVEDFHGPARIFNAKLKSLVYELNKHYPDSKFIYLDDFGSFQELLDSPSSYGFTITNKGCCGSGRNNGKVTCKPNQVPCRDRNLYLFWDAYHLTEAATLAAVKKLFYTNSTKSFTYPMSILRLAKL